MDATDDWVLDWLESTDKVLMSTSKLLQDFSVNWKISGKAVVHSETFKDQCRSTQGKIFQAIVGLTNFLDELHPSRSIPWLPNDASLFENMLLLEGRSPSSFVLRYSLLDCDPMKDITITSQNYIGEPKLGSFVLCLHHATRFRGYMLKSLSVNRYKVLNVDSNEVVIVPKSAIHHLPQELCETHALSIHCTMLQSDEVIKQYWSEDLEGIFLNALRDRPLRVKIVRNVSECPPKYLVELVATSDFHQDVNLSDWINQILIPDIDRHLHLILSNDELPFLLDDDSVDPFFHIHSQSHLSVLQDLHQVNFRDLDLSSPGSVGGRESPSAIPELILAQNPPAPTPPQPKSSERKCLPIKPLVERYPSFQFDVMERKTPTFYKGSSSSDTQRGNSDGARAKKRPSIRSLPCYPGAVNVIDLPEIGEEFIVRIGRVLDDLSFFVFFEDEFSRYSKNGIYETKDTLFSRLNNPGGAARRPFLDYLPKPGQFLIFQDGQGRWCRGIVIGVSEEGGSYHIMNPDLGTFEYLPCDLTRFRPIEPEDRILPFQAVLCVLYRARCMEGKNPKAVAEHIQFLTQSRALCAVVRNVMEQENGSPIMELEIFSDDRVSLNQVLINDGLCYDDKL